MIIDIVWSAILGTVSFNFERMTSLAFFPCIHNRSQCSRHWSRFKTIVLSWSLLPEQDRHGSLGLYCSPELCRFGSAYLFISWDWLRTSQCEGKVTKKETDHSTPLYRCLELSSHLFGRISRRTTVHMPLILNKLLVSCLFWLRYLNIRLAILHGSNAIINMCHADTVGGNYSSSLTIARILDQVCHLVPEMQWGKPPRCLFLF